jgi:hypothetical protein
MPPNTAAEESYTRRDTLGSRLRKTPAPHGCTRISPGASGLEMLNLTKSDCDEIQRAITIANNRGRSRMRTARLATKQAP